MGLGFSLTLRGVRLMKLGDTVQTLNTFIPVTGKIVALNNTLHRVMIKDNDPLTLYEFKEYDTQDVEVVS